jgi:polysaccharide export outer membrane protein
MNQRAPKPDENIMHVTFVNQLSRSPVLANQRAVDICRFLACLLCGLLLVIGSGCQSLTQSDYDYYVNGLTLPGITQGQVDYSTNLLHEGDVVDIDFQYSTNFSTIQKINLDGALNLNSVGMVKASGRTVMELQQEVARLYKSQVKDDVITVKLVSSGASVYVGGAVLRAGAVELGRPLTVLEAIVSAGGLDTSRAKLTDVKVVRIKRGKQLVYSVNLKRVLQGKDPQPFYLEPFDIIYVPAKTFNY